MSPHWVLATALGLIGCGASADLKPSVPVATRAAALTTLDVTKPDRPRTTRAIMAAVSDELVAHNIHVAGVTPPSDSTVAVLRPLADMPAPSNDELRSESDFSILFRETMALDAAGYTMVLCANGEVARTSVRDRPTYRARWHSTPVDERVFLSFTRRDLAIARTVQAAFERIGLQVFTYLANEDNSIWTNSVDVGHYFDSAGHHVVVDTPNARASVATRFEQLALTDLWHRSRPAAESLDDAVERLRTQRLFVGTPEKNAHVCCRICVGPSGTKGAPEGQCGSIRSQDQAESSCGPVICGSQCQNAY